MFGAIFYDYGILSSTLLCLQCFQFEHEVHSSYSGIVYIFLIFSVKTLTIYVRKGLEARDHICAVIFVQYWP